MDEYFEFRKSLETIINQHSIENKANVPDFIIADYLINCLKAFNISTQERDKWYGVHLEPANSFFLKTEDDIKKEVEDFKIKFQPRHLDKGMV